MDTVDREEQEREKRKRRSSRCAIICFFTYLIIILHISLTLQTMILLRKTISILNALMFPCL